MFNIQDLENIYNKLKPLKIGKNAEYIPELKKVNPNIYSISVCNISGESYDIGDYNTEIAIESVSKVFTLALALKKHSITKVSEKIGHKYSSDPFNSVMALEKSKTHTINPFVNGGAMATTSLLYNNRLTKNQNKDSITKNILDNMSSFAGKKLKINYRIYHSEMDFIHHNKGIAYLLYSYNRFYGDVDTVVDVYTKQCSVMVSSKDVALMAATIANYGVNPSTKERLLTKKQCEFIIDCMIEGGLYNYSNEFYSKVGIPAKSGVGGVIMLVIPGVMGIAIVSPPLDKNGNSAKGIKTAELISKLSIQ
jgi:glutaminase